MSAIALAALALAGTAGARAPVATWRYGTPGWTVTVREDRFAGTRRCVIRSRDRRMLYQPGAVGARVRDRDTMGALYRVDDHAVVRWQDRYPTLVAAGITVEGPGLDDPTGRIVWVPEAELRGARILTIRTAKTGWGKRYRLRALDAMIDAARRLDCTISTGFGG